MAGQRDYRFCMVLGFFAALAIAQNPVEERTTFEAAFQGKTVIYLCGIIDRRLLITINCFVSPRKTVDARLGKQAE